jgi:hypothetical protein
MTVCADLDGGFASQSFDRFARQQRSSAVCMNLIGMGDEKLKGNHPKLYG